MTDQPRRLRLSEMKQRAEQSQNEVGMLCPKCKFDCLPVLYTRPQSGGIKWRVRQCRRCGHKVLCEEKIIGDIEPRLPPVPKSF